VLATLSVVLPIFALILAGYICRRAGIFGPAASSELNRFVVWLGLPALFFAITAKASWQDLYQPAFAATFALACFIVFVLTLPLRRQRGQADASIDGLNAAYPNSGYMGFPLCFLVFGPESFTTVTISAIITVCLLFGFAIVLIEFSLQKDKALGPMVLSVFASLAKNPLLVSPVLGVLFSASGLPMPKSADTFVNLLGAAASPCALVALGVFLAQREPSHGRDLVGAILLTGLKLLALPAVTWALAHYVFALPKTTADMAVLLAALPTGTGPFMLAEYYKREPSVTADTILYSTVLSVLTISAFLYFQGYGTA
jgi:predicted permease